MPQIAKGTEIYLGQGKMMVTRTSIFSGKERTIELPLYPEQIYAWKAGRPIQEAMPQLTDDQREFLMTGATPKEWESLKEEES